ncbi:hypothetical protein H5410_006173 [Solanum commersonii]|uniref:Putative plant transposon protein domain-containing protein n=1 Tax=Solanum commersonii TaxID=4109 RepID=A0A9J6A9K2_SOLCO|nr:hypothetical protein H5410_006173 [Solanum commersonii]
MPHQFDELGNYLSMLLVTMSSSHRPDKKVAISSNRKRVQSGNVPPTPAFPRGQTRRFGVKVVTKEGKAWYKKHTDATYFSDVCVDEDNLARDFPQFRREFYTNWAPEARSHYVMIPSLYYNDIMRDRVCLVYALMTGMKLNIGTIIKSSMSKARVHKGHRYAFGGLITRMCRVTGVPEENLEYMAPLYPAPVDITLTKVLDTDFGSTLTIVECHRRDQLIMARMYGLEMLRHKTGSRPSTDLEIREVNRRYLLNDHAKALLGIGLEFQEPTDEENLCTGSDVESNSDEEIDPIHVEAKADEGDIMED